MSVLSVSMIISVLLWVIGYTILKNTAEVASTTNLYVAGGILSVIGGFCTYLFLGLIIYCWFMS
jgi:hypothetical protein